MSSHPEHHLSPNTYTLPGGDKIEVQPHGRKADVLTRYVPEALTHVSGVGDILTYIQIGEFLLDDGIKALKGDELRLPPKIFEEGQPIKLDYLSVHFATKFAALTADLRDSYHSMRYEQIVNAFLGSAAGAFISGLMLNGATGWGFMVETIKHGARWQREWNELKHIRSRRGHMEGDTYVDPEDLEPQMRRALEKLGIPQDQYQTLRTLTEAKRLEMHAAYDRMTPEEKTTAREKSQELALIDLQIQNAGNLINAPRRISRQIAPQTTQALERFVGNTLRSEARRRLNQYETPADVDPHKYLEQLHALRDIVRVQCYEYDFHTHSYRPYSEIHPQEQQ